MRSRPTLLMVVMVALACGATASDGERVIRNIHERYTGKRFTDVTFVQSTRTENGNVELWYEAIRPAGLVRVDIAPLSNRNGFMYRADSMYVFRAGQVTVTKANERWITMLLLVDIYALPVERSLTRLRELGVDVSRTYNTEWNRKPVVVVGATAGDTVSAQAWFDRDQLYPVRVIQPASAAYPRIDFQIDGHRFMSGGWIETEIRIVIDGRIVTKECYGEIRADANLPDRLFDPAQFDSVRWAEARYGSVERGPNCPAW
jgi:hypothetical protein